MNRREKPEAEIYCEIKEAFQIFDRDNDGIITKEEELTILRMFGINQKEKEDTKDKKEDKKQKEQTEKGDEEEGEGTDQINGEEEKPQENKVQTVEFNEFFDNIINNLKDATKDSELLEDVDYNFNNSNKVTKKLYLLHEIEKSGEYISKELKEKIINSLAPGNEENIVMEDFVKYMLNKA